MRGRAATRSLLVCKLRIVQQVGQTEHVADRLPLAFAGGADEDRPSVRSLEEVVDRPGRFSHRHGGGRFAGHGELLHVLRRQEHAVLEQAALDALTAAGVLTLAQRREHADDAPHPAHDVVDGGPGAHRLPGRTRHVGEPAHHLHDLVERRAVLVGAGQETLVRHIDQPRIVRAQIVTAEAHRVELPGLEVLAEDIGACRPACARPRDLPRSSGRARRCACCG